MKIYTIGNSDIVRRHLVHNHDKDLTKTKLQILSAIAKRKATENIFFSLSKMIHTILRELPSYNDLNRIKRNVYNSGRRYIPNYQVIVMKLTI